MSGWTLASTLHHGHPWWYLPSRAGTMIGLLVNMGDQHWGANIQPLNADRRAYSLELTGCGWIEATGEVEATLRFEGWVETGDGWTPRLNAQHPHNHKVS